MENIESIRKQIKKLTGKLWSLEHKAAGKQNAHLLGKYFKQRNNYSCPEKPSDYWNIYSHVTKVDGNRVTVTTFQVDKYGHAMFRTNEQTFGHLVGGVISKKEYLAAFKKFNSKIKLPSPTGAE